MISQNNKDLDSEKFRKIQSLAYEAVVEIRQSLEEGMTEKYVAGLIDQTLRSKGIDGFFHTGFAWFGDRTCFKGFTRPGVFPKDLSKNFDIPHFGWDFLPTDRKLEKGMAVVLDVAPILDGYSADVGYSFAFGENSEIDRAIMDLEIFRTEILNMVLAEKRISEIYQNVDKMILDMGYRNCHSLYPMGVLGHKLGKIPFSHFPSPSIMGFQFQTFTYLLWESLGKNFEEIITQNHTVWTDTSNLPAQKGFWAIEPHIGKKDIGVKWEEILVVNENSAYWLDDDLPHVNFWKQNQKLSNSVLL